MESGRKRRGRHRSAGTSSAEAVAGLFDDHVWDVYGFVVYRLGNRADAEDVTQQTFERALKAWRSFDPDRGQAKTWLLAIAQNLVIDHHRRDRSKLNDPIGEDGVAEADLPAEPAPEPGGLPAPLADAIVKLKPRDREVLALRFGGDMRGTEIAEMLDLKLSNVQQILSRSLRKIRAELERDAAPKRKPRKRA